MNRYKIEINVDYDEGLEKRYLFIETNDDRNTVADNIKRAETVINTTIFDEYDSYEDYYKEESKYNDKFITKEEYGIMIKCFDGYNEDTFEYYLQEKYGYKTESLHRLCDFEVTIN